MQARRPAFRYPTGFQVPSVRAARELSYPNTGGPQEHRSLTRRRTGQGARCARVFRPTKSSTGCPKTDRGTRSSPQRAKSEPARSARRRRRRWRRRSLGAGDHRPLGWAADWFSRPVCNWVVGLRGRSGNQLQATARAKPHARLARCAAVGAETGLRHSFPPCRRRRRIEAGSPPRLVPSHSSRRTPNMASRERRLG